MDGVAARMFLLAQAFFFLRILENTRRGEVFRLWLGRLLCCDVLRHNAHIPRGGISL